MDLESDVDLQTDENSKNLQIKVVIPNEYSDNYETALDDTANYSFNTAQAITGKSTVKYYKQTYRSAWEHMPDFKGWLTGVAGEPTRAYCIYCQKTLHAHRLSLLKHTCTIRHQKAAQIHQARKNKSKMDPTQGNSSKGTLQTEQETVDDDDDDYMNSETGYNYDEEILPSDELDLESEENDENDLKLDNQKVSTTMTTTVPVKSPISTHVLDTSRGHAVSGLQVTLYKLIEGRWTYINEGMTTTEGRFASFLERNTFTVGRYKLHFDVDRYFEQRKEESLYPFIEVVFDCRNAEEHYHIPVLLNPFGYTTYRGT